MNPGQTQRVTVTLDAPFPGDNGHPRRNQYINNYVHHNAGHGIFLSTADDNTFTGNLFEANSSQLVFISGQRNRLESNSIPRNVIVRTQGIAPLPSSTYARNQPALAIQLDSGRELRLRVAGVVSSLAHDGRVAYVPARALLAVDPAAADSEQLAFEKETLGLYWSGHPIDRYADGLRDLGAKTIADLAEAQPTAARGDSWGP